jgi:hypothetical protein
LARLGAASEEASPYYHTKAGLSGVAPRDLNLGIFTMPVKSKSTQLSENKLARNEPSGLYAVVDIGSNSVRLVVYDRLSRAPLPRFNEKSLCRLADGLAETSELSEESCRRTVEAVRRFRAVADAMRVDRVDSIATEAVRRATNGAQLLARIAKEAGFKVQVLRRRALRR